MQTFVHLRNNKDYAYHQIDRILKLCKHQQPELYLFPITTNGQNDEVEPYHWTLLTYDVDTVTWRFYNSLKSADGAEDVFYNDAKVLVSFSVFTISNTRPNKN